MATPRNLPNFIKAMKEYHSKKDPESYATLGMLGKKQSEEWLTAIKKANKCPVVVRGTFYESVGAAEKDWPTCRKHLDDGTWPNTYRIRNRIKRK